MQTVLIETAKPYAVCIEDGLLTKVGGQIAAVTDVCTAAVISDDTVFSLYGNTVCDSLESAGFRVVHFAFPHGEVSKNLDTYGKILHFLAENQLTRSDVLVALGGGVVGDLSGFAAATYLRGIPYVQIPTTLLAAVDSSVGGKTAIDLPAGKNLAGCFYQPALVLCDPQVLCTLPEEVYRDGCAEVIKYAVLESEPFFRELAQCPAAEQYTRVISACVAWKRDYVCADELDQGKRRFLNLGHSFGHAVECCSGYTVSHGCAVAIGLAMISRAAAKRGFCAPETRDSILALLRQYMLPTQTDIPAEHLLQKLCADKKRSGDTISLIVPEAIGRCRVETVSLSDLPGWLADGGAL